MDVVLFIIRMDFLHNEKHFKDGRLHGIFRAWDEDGALFFEIQYENDIVHGPDKSYRKNGILELEEEYRHGVLFQRKIYDEMGTLKYLQKYGDDGKLKNGEEKKSDDEAKGDV